MGLTFVMIAVNLGTSCAIVLACNIILRVQPLHSFPLTLMMVLIPPKLTFRATINIMLMGLHLLRMVPLLLLLHQALLLLICLWKPGHLVNIT